ncbi:MAG: glycosyltransferase family 4 protein, partial [Candidatus Aminicenantes bacterium]
MKEKARLLFVTHLFYPAVGGVEIHIKNLSAGLVKRGYRVKVLTTNAYSTVAFFLGDKRRIDKTAETIDGTEVERLGFKTFGSRILNKLCLFACRVKYPFNSWIRFLSFGPRNRRFIDKIIAHNPDVIFAAPLPNLNVYYAYKAAKRLKKPLVIIPSYHIFDPCCFYNKIFFKMMREADIVMAQSPMEKDYLAKEGSIDADKIIILPPFPLKEHQLEPVMRDKTGIRQRYGIEEKFVVLYLGQHGPHKNISPVLEGMKYVWQDIKDTALVIAGGITPYTKTLKNQAARLEKKCQGKVYFLDNFPEKEKDAVFQMADIFISLSEMESFGIVFVEAMNNGLPVIASKNCVARYIVDDFKTGILVNPASITEVAGALIELLSDKSVRDKYSQWARQKVKDTCHPGHILKKWEEVI